MLTNKKAVSTIILIILILCSAVFGAFISYMWVMGIYYKMPENTSLLMVTDVQFSVYNARYFNATILNPSNSVLDMNITAIDLSIEESDEKYETYEITDVELYGAMGPESIQFPYLIRKGTEQKFKCNKNWGGFAGKNVKIEPVAHDSSTKSFSYKTPTVKLTAQTPDPEEWTTVESFNLTVRNAQESEIDLTISDITVSKSSISEKVTPKLPQNLSLGQEIIFQCDYNWESLKEQNVTLTVKTSEGYEATFTTNKLLGAALYIDKVEFDYAGASYFNLTISNSEDSTASATINQINLTLQDGTKVVINETFPSIEVPSLFNLIPSNESRTFKCFWNWNQYRNETLTVDAYALEGFTIPSKTTKTPPAVVWNMTDVNFDLDYMEHFSVNVTNTHCSLQNITVTKILLDETEATMVPAFAVLIPGKQVMFNCTLPWASLRGKNVTITIVTQDQSKFSRIVTIPSVGLKLLDKPAISEFLGPYVNITISNSNNSLQNVTITKIIFETGNWTGSMIAYLIDGTVSSPAIAPDGYILKSGEKVTIVCRWNWSLYLLPRLKVTVYTAEGVEVSKTFTP